MNQFNMPLFSTGLLRQVRWWVGLGVGGGVALFFTLPLLPTNKATLLQWHRLALCIVKLHAAGEEAPTARQTASMSNDKVADHREISLITLE